MTTKIGTQATTSKEYIERINECGYDYFKAFAYLNTANTDISIESGDMLDILGTYLHIIMNKITQLRKLKNPTKGDRNESEQLWQLHNSLYTHDNMDNYEIVAINKIRHFINNYINPEIDQTVSKTDNEKFNYIYSLPNSLLIAGVEGLFKIKEMSTPMLNFLKIRETQKYVVTKETIQKGAKIQASIYIRVDNDTDGSIYPNVHIHNTFDESDSKGTLYIPYFDNKEKSGITSIELFDEYYKVCLFMDKTQKA
jgi:hypothetical protein